MGASSFSTSEIIAGTKQIKPTTIKRPMKKPRLLLIIFHPNRIASLLENFCVAIFYLLV